MTVGAHPRGTGTAARLARLGFIDPGRAAATLATTRLGEPGCSPDATTAEEVVLTDLAEAADPDLALAALGRLLDAADARAPAEAEALRRALADPGRPADAAGDGASADGGPGLRRRLFAVLGSSIALGDHLARHPGDWRTLAADSLAAVRPSQLGLRVRLLAAVGGLSGAAAHDALRVDYRRCLLALAARDIGDGLTVDDVAGELADLAAATLDAALAIARTGLGDADAPCRLAIIGMGKCGGRELNYVSDVDVVFVAEPLPGDDEAAAVRTATKLAASLMRACSATTAEGSIWPVDTALRPEGRDGPLVRTLASHLAYYGRWARTWEFQALVKARAVAGDLGLGQAYVDGVRPLVWRAAERPDFVPEVQAMRRRVEASLPLKEAARELKLGPGGLRDVEFSVQLLQLVHGRADESLRSGGTLAALAALAAGGYVGRADADTLAAAYRFLRLLEHRLQLQRLRRTHLLPTTPAALRWLARSTGFGRDGGDPVGQLLAEHLRHAREVRRLHEKLFYRPLLTAVARLPAEQSRLRPEAARERLEALGFADPAGALRHLEALTAGVSRRAAIQRTLLPVMLAWFADAADPDGGLLSFRQVSEALGSTSWYLRLLRDEGATAERLARLLATSRYVADMLGRSPQSVTLLADDAELVPRVPAALATELAAAVERGQDPETAVAAVRGIRRRELLRTACADLLGRLDVDSTGVAISAVTAATVRAALGAAEQAVTAARGGQLPVRMAVIAMGRFGGAEQGYSSDADVLFVHEPRPGTADATAAEAALQVATELRRLLALPGPEPPMEVDAALRPEGRQGPLTRSLTSYGEYYRRWSLPWEAQALLRAVPVAGDDDLGRRFTELVAPVRWPASGISDAAVRELRRIKARVEAERLPRGADPALHTKLGRGGLADIEWTVQLLQLRHAAGEPALRTTSTLDGLVAAVEAGRMSRADGTALAEAWRFVTRVRNAITLVRGRPADSVPTRLPELGGVARAVGYPAGHASDLLEDYRRHTRRARAVVERVFYA